MLFENIQNQCIAAKKAAPSIAHATTKHKNDLLFEIAKALVGNMADIIAANAIDIENSDKNGVPKTMLDRLKLDESRIEGICNSLYELIKLNDPIGSGDKWVRPNGLEIECVRAPIGVIGIIFEARPNVTVDAAALCLKTGNVAVLRGGKEAICSNMAIVKIMRSTIGKLGFDENIVSLVESTERESANILMQMSDYVDVLIPRGGKGLIRAVKENSKIPVIETGAGNCHLYIDEGADLKMAVDIAVNAKCSRPSVCNAIETVLVHRSIAKEFLVDFIPAVKIAGFQLEYRADDYTLPFIDGAISATDEDYYTEYNDFIIAIKTVNSVDEAIKHINKYSTGHSEAIVTKSLGNARAFQQEVNSAAVYVNASTRFTDGGEFGFGAQIGISTQKLHARGPMGLIALTTEKYLIEGNGNIR